jgi:hypothetical protein
VNQITYGGGGAVGQGATMQAKTASTELQEMTHSEYVELQHSHR